MKNIYLTGIALIATNILFAQSTQRLTLIEGLTSNTCGPCASWNGSYGPVIENNNPNTPYSAGVAVIKYQMDWPAPGSDPSFNNDGDTRRGFYGTTGIPDWYIDGLENTGTQAQIDTRKNTPAELYITSSYTLTGNTINVSVKIVPLVYLGNGNRLFIALANKSYVYTGGTNGESTFKHVLRKMLPNGAGIFLPTLNANDTLTFNQSYTYNVVGVPAQNSYDFWNSTFEVITWVQRTTGSKPVHNAAIAAEGSLGIEEGDKDDFGIIVYPNPGNEQTTIMFDGDGSDYQIKVFNNLGALVFSEKYGSLSGRQRIALNTLSFAEGMYFVRIESGKNVATNPLVITR